MLDYLPYIIIPLLLLLALIIKDWDAYKKPWVRFLVLSLIILSGAIGIINQRFSDIRAEKKEQKAEKQHQADQIEITGLKEAVIASTRDQENNTTHFLEEFGKLSQKMSDLQTQVKTAELKKEVAELQAELQKTQKALNPPKAVLTFTFERPGGGPRPLRTVTLPVKDNVVHVEFAVRNSTDTPALDGEIIVIICDACKFASEPPELIKLSGQKETIRTYKFDRIFPMGELKTLNADVQVPPNLDSIEFGIDYRCRNCIIPEPHANIGIINLDRRR